MMKPVLEVIWRFLELCNSPRPLLEVVWKRSNNLGAIREVFLEIFWKLSNNLGAIRFLESNGKLNLGAITQET